MKVIDVYDSHSDLRSFGKNIFTTTFNYLKRFPIEYSNCFKRNLATLELIKVNKMDDGVTTGRYNTIENIIEFAESRALGHEMFHVASNDLVNDKYAFESNIDVESGLIEGMTEYFCMNAYDLKYPSSYPFEVVTVMMLEDIPDIFKHYFIPNNKEFLNIFPNRKDIYGLLYSINAYNGIMLDYLASIYTDEDILVDIKELVASFKYTIANLINIELSFEKDPVKLKAYRDKFLDLMHTKWIEHTFKNVYPNYLAYTEKYVNKKIKEKR